MSRSSLRPHHKVGLLAGLIGLVVVLGFAVSGVMGSGSGLPPAASPGVGRVAGGHAGDLPSAPPRRGRLLPGSRRGAPPPPHDQGPVAPVPDGVSLVSAGMPYGGHQRTWLLATPQQELTGKRLPLLIDLHGRNSSPRFAAQQSGLLSWVARGQAIAVFPAGYDQSWNADGCCGTAAADHVDDLGFLRALTLRLATRPDVDPGQLGLLGFSNGGRMALDLACSRYLSGDGLTLRAVVAVESINSSRCVRGPGISTLVTAGTADPFVGYDEPTLDPAGGRLPSAQQEVAGWSSSERCATPTVSAGVFPRETFDCPTGSLSLVTIPGGRHRWPPAIDPTIEAFLSSAIAVPAV